MGFLWRKGLILPDWPQTHYLSEYDLDPPASTSFWNHRHASPGLDYVMLGNHFMNTRHSLYQLRYTPSLNTTWLQEQKAILDLPNTSPGLVKEPIIIFEKNLLKIQVKISKDSLEERIKVPTRADDKNRDFCVRPTVGIGQAHLPLQACLPPCEAGCWDCSALRIQGRWTLDTQSMPRITLPHAFIHPYSCWRLGLELEPSVKQTQPWALQILL